MGNQTSYPEVSVIVAVYNRLQELELCLQALRACRTDGGGIELIVVDDRSTEDVHNVADKYDARYFRMGTRGGPAAARNLGAKESGGKIIVFVDADVLVGPDAVEIIVAEFAVHPDISALFGSYDDAPARDNFSSSFKNLMHHHVHQASQEEAATFWTGCGAIRKEAFETTGGFDAIKYPAPSIEDIELGLRLAQERKKIRLVKRLQVKHLKRWTLASLVRTDIFYRAIPWAKLILRTRNLPRDLNLSWASRISATLVALLGMVGVAWALGAALSARVAPPALLAGAAVAIMAGLVRLNFKLYELFWSKRGPVFASRAVVMHWFYLFYSGSVFAYCCASELMRGRVQPPAQEAALGKSSS